MTTADPVTELGASLQQLADRLASAERDLRVYQHDGACEQVKRVRLELRAIAGYLAGVQSATAAVRKQRESRPAA